MEAGGVWAYEFGGNVPMLKAYYRQKGDIDSFSTSKSGETEHLFAFVFKTVF